MSFICNAAEAEKRIIDFIRDEFIKYIEIRGMSYSEVSNVSGIWFYTIRNIIDDPYSVRLKKYISVAELIWGVGSLQIGVCYE